MARWTLLVLMVWWSFSQTAFAADYLPLQVGNRWEYVRVQNFEVVQTTTGQTYLLGIDGQVFDSLTLQPLPENSIGDISAASHYREERALPGSEFSLEVVARLTVGSNTCYRMSTGQLLRSDPMGRLLECHSTGAPETELFNFSGVTSEYEEFRFGTLLPFGEGESGRLGPHYRVAMDAPVDTRIGTFRRTVRFGITGGVSWWGVVFAPGVGVVRSGSGDDTGAASGIMLIGGRVAGRELGVTGMLPATWGTIKAGTRFPANVGHGR